VDTYFDFYGDDTDEILTMSVIDLANVKPVVTAMGDLMRLCSEGLTDASSFKTLAGKRLRTKTFGEGSPRDNECDMVDIGDMADELSDLYPTETGKILTALKDCVLYNRHNGSVSLSGLSAYYIYGGRKLGKDALKTYSSLPVSTAYRSYQRSFYNALTTQSETPADDTREITRVEYVLWKPNKSGVYQMAALKDGTGSNWPHFNGQPVCLFLVARTNRSRYYAIPAEINGRDCDIIVVINDANLNGLIEGARNRTGTIIQKGYDPINAGDKITLYTAETDINVKRGRASRASGASQASQVSQVSVASQELKWKKGAEFTMGEEEAALNLTWEAKPEGCVEGSRVTDLVGVVEYGVGG
jgi:hypothetical protein